MAQICICQHRGWRRIESTFHGPFVLSRREPTLHPLGGIGNLVRVTLLLLLMRREPCRNCGDTNRR